MATGKGPSYGFWLRVQRELDEQGISQRELVARSNVTHSIINNLRDTGIRDRVRRRANVLALADVLRIPHDEALQLAGLAETSRTAADSRAEDVRAAIGASDDLDADQKDALFKMLDLFARDRPRRRARGAANESAAETA